MRNFLLIIISMILLAFSGMSMASEVEAGKTDLGKHPYKSPEVLANEYSHWSLIFGAGLNMTDCDFKLAAGYGIIDRLNPLGTVSLSYDFTPIWGLMGSYTYMINGLNHSVFNPSGSAFKVYENNGTLPSRDGALKGQLHMVELFATIDLIDAWFPSRRTNIFSLQFLAGLGLTFQECTALYASGDIMYANGKSGSYKFGTSLSFGATAEFNVSRSIGVGLRGLFHRYTDDNFDTRMTGTYNDALLEANIYLRYKINAKRKNHVANCSQVDMWPTKESLLANAGKDCDVDSVYIFNRDTVVISTSSSLIDSAQVQTIAEKIAEQKMQEQTQLATLISQYVYFNLNSAELTDAGLQAIQQVASVLLADTSLCLEISAWCDNTGSDEFNKSLGERRAKRVRQEFISVYGIDAVRMVAINRGRITNVNAAYSPNRRVDMRLCHKDDLKRLQEEQACTVVQTNVDLAASVVAQHDVKTTVVSDEYTTFARLAHKYYKNAHCWPFIYAANPKVVMKNNPDLIMRDMEIIIPALSEAEINGASKANEQAMLAAIATNK